MGRALARWRRPGARFRLESVLAALRCVGCGRRCDSRARTVTEVAKSSLFRRLSDMTAERDKRVICARWGCLRPCRRARSGTKSSEIDSVPLCRVEAGVRWETRWVRVLGGVLAEYRHRDIVQNVAPEDAGPYTAVLHVGSRAVRVHAHRLDGEIVEGGG